MSNLLSRITINPKQCGGRPCIRGMRIRVSDVLDLFAAGLNAEQILEEMPDLEEDDLKSALLYASCNTTNKELLSEQKNDFTDAANYVLKKNAELYRRLA